jgi:protein-S-isoprenylcysteine O-methyltransferase Ste14
MLLILGFILVFGYFAAIGATMFERDESDVKGAMWGGFSMLVTGSIAPAMLSFGQPLRPLNGIAAASLLLLSVALYEWARRTIRDRRFHIAWSGDVPEAVCAEGPYAYVRHPVYLSYLLAFLAVPIAFPMLATLAILAFNLALYVHAAHDDERSLARSGLGEAYAAYKRRTGMFFPRLRAVA